MTVNGAASATVVANARSAVRPLPRAVRDAVCVSVLCLTDLAAVSAACALGALEQGVLRRWFPFKDLTIFGSIEGAGFLFTVIACGFLLRGLYSRRESFWETVRLTFTTTFLSLLVAIAALYLVNVAGSVPRSLAILAGVNLLVIAPIMRLLAIRLLRFSRVWCRHVVVIGKRRQAEAVAADLENDFALGYRVAAIHPIPDGVERGVIGATEYPPGMDEAVIVTPDMAPETVPAMVASAQRAVATVTVVPEFVDLPFAARSTRCLFDSRRMLLTSRNLLREPVNVAVKRAFDIVVSLLLAVVALPVMAIMALAIRFDSRGPGIFAQQRMGRAGRRFRCLKFRTMYIDAEERLKKLLESDAALREEWEQFHKLKRDPRVTRVGEFLRSTSLDELPQLLNVIAGQMSLVGPRPLPEYHFEKVDEPFASDYLDVTPGITGLWQVSGRADADLQRMVVLNSWYARNWSLWLDVTLLLRTVPVVLLRRGAY